MRRKVLFAVVVTILGCVVWWLGKEYLSVDVLAQREAALRELLERQPVHTWLIGFLIYIVVSLFPGTSGKSVLCGWLFGFWQSLLMVTFALTVAAVVGFSISRFLLRDAVRRWLGTRIEALNQKVDSEGAFYMLTVRMMHIPFTAVNYAAGASSLPTRTFAWTTLVGLIPSTAVFVGLGSTLPTIAQLKEKGAHGLISWPLAMALVLMGAIPWLLRAMVRKFRPSLHTAAQRD